MQEEINIGNLTKYGILTILQYLGNNQTDLLKLNMKPIKNDQPVVQYYTPDLSTPMTSTETNQMKSVFIMFAHINTTINTTNKALVCNAVKDTLDYATSISIGSGIGSTVGPTIGALYSSIPTGGFFNKKQNNKKFKLNIIQNYKPKRFSSMKNLNHLKKNKGLFSTKTKKNK